MINQKNTFDNFNKDFKKQGRHPYTDAFLKVLFSGCPGQYSSWSHPPPATVLATLAAGFTRLFRSPLVSRAFFMGRLTTLNCNLVPFSTVHLSKPLTAFLGHLYLPPERSVVGLRIFLGSPQGKTNIDQKNNYSDNYPKIHRKCQKIHHLLPLMTD